MSFQQDRGPNLHLSGAWQGKRSIRSSVETTKPTNKRRGPPRVPRPSLQAQSRHAGFLALPMEIKQRIYDFVFTEWSLAVFDSPGRHQEHQVQQRQYNLDRTIVLQRCYSKLVSGPPGCSLMLTCRTAFHSTRHRYGTGFTGRLIINDVGNPLSSDVVSYLSRFDKLKKWYSAVHTLSATLKLNTERVRSRLEHLFPKLSSVGIVMYSDDPSLLGRPLHRVAGEVMQGREDPRISARMVVATHAFFGSIAVVDAGLLHLYYEPPMRSRRKDVNVKLIYWTPNTTNHVLGFNVQWTGYDFRILSRAIRTPDSLSYWTDDLLPTQFETVEVEDQSNNSIPEKFRWLQTEGGNFTLS